MSDKITLRDQFCGQVTKQNVGQTLKVCGWVAKSRDHGGVIFIDLFDYSGVVQLVCNPDCADFAQIEKLSTHSVLCITGHVRLRPEGTTNANLATGDVEVVIEKITWLNIAAPLGFDVNDVKVGDDVRAQHRMLDIRSERMQRNLRFRAKMIASLRSYMESKGFLEVETPILTRATPEGARDYLVPSRNHPGQAFALPQSPQQFKQLLMMGAIDRYYQFARCFRDEDLRADRQPEFTQLDIEMSFMQADEICALIEDMVLQLVTDMTGESLDTFLQMSYDDAMRYYGTDAPNLSNPLKLCPLDHVFEKCDFAVFQAPASADDGRVVALKIPGGAKHFSRKALDMYTNQVAKLGAKGLAYIKVNDKNDLESGLNSPILKFLEPSHIQAVLDETKAENDDLIFFGAGSEKLVNLTMSALAKQIAHDLSLFKEGMHFVWIKDFPMFEKIDGGLTAIHHPFTAPHPDDEGKLETARAQAYDLVLNGYELGGGSIRIHDAQMQQKVFDLLGIDAQKARQEFGHLLDGLNQGCPLHGGLAFGIDRMCMVLMGIDSMREVIAFPKTQTASCALTKAPGAVAPSQWRELGLSALKGEGSGRA